MNWNFYIDFSGINNYQWKLTSLFKSICSFNLSICCTATCWWCSSYLLDRYRLYNRNNHTNCNNDACHILFIICSKCSEKLDGCCSKECQDIFHLPLDKQKMIRKKFAKKFANKFRPSVQD